MFLLLRRQTWYNFVVKTSIRRQDALGWGGWIQGEFIDGKCIYILFETLLTPNLDVGDNSRLLKWQRAVALREAQNVRGRLCLLVCSISHTDTHMGMSWVRPGSTQTHTYTYTITKSTYRNTHTLTHTHWSIVITQGSTGRRRRVHYTQTTTTKACSLFKVMQLR